MPRGERGSAKQIWLCGAEKHRLTHYTIEVLRTDHSATLWRASATPPPSPRAVARPTQQLLSVRHRRAAASAHRALPYPSPSCTRVPSSRHA